jgi:hypothetical protein
MSKLLEEAIIDAKALKEAALKSAQEAILEKYTPEVKKAIESMLLEQDDPLADPDLDSLTGDAPADPAAGTLNGQIPMGATNGMNLCPCPDKEIEIDFADLQKAMSSVDTQTGMTNDMSNPLAAPLTPAPEQGPVAPDVNANVAPEVPPMPPEEEEETPVMEEEIELSEEFINSLLEDEELFQEHELEEAKDGVPETERERILASMSPPKNKITRGDVVAARIASGKNGKDLEEDARYQPSQDSTEAIKDRMNAKEKARIAANQMAAIRNKNLQESKTASSNQTLLLIEKSSQLLQEHKKAQVKNKLLTEENARLFKEHSEMKATALTLSKRLEEMNLQNAKLYYKNQALGSVSLNERQKNNIVEAISKAGSVDKVKIIFETLQSAVGSGNKFVREPKSLSEAVTRNEGFNIRLREKEQPVENSAVERWQKIAGIKK